MAHGRHARRRRTALRAQKRREHLRTRSAADPEASAAVVATLERRRERRAHASVSDTFEVTGSTSLPLSDRDTAWDAGAAAKSLDDGDYAKAYFWHDQSKPDDQVTSYKLGFASKAGGTLTAIFRGITAVAGVLQGARGGVKGISSADTAGIKDKVETYYGKAADKYDDPDIKVPWKADESKGETAAILLAYAETGGISMVRLEDGMFANVAGEPEAVAAFNERLAFWTAEFEADDEAPAATLEDAEIAESHEEYADQRDQLQDELDTALASMEEQLATMPDCADCDHAYADHLGSSGPCTMEDCECTSYDESDGEAVGHAIAFAHIAFERDSADPQSVRLVLVPDGDPDANLPFDRLAEHLAAFDLAADDDPVNATIPDVHKPGSRQVRRNPSPRNATQPDGEAQREPGQAAEGAQVFEWSAILAPEGKLTSDRRAFAPESITWRDLPLTLMAMTETSEGGHIGAEVAGRMDQIWRDDSDQASAQYSAVALIRSRGVFATTEYGQEIAGLVDDKTLRGVSVDLAIAEYVTGPKSNWFNEDGDWAPKEDAPTTPSLIDLYSDDTIAVVLQAEIGMATVCPFQAFADAKIAMGDSLVAGANPAFWTVTMDAGWAVTRCEPCEDAIESLTAAAIVEQCGEALVASAQNGYGYLAAVTADTDVTLTAAAAGLAPEKPPAAWFADPAFDELTPITVTDDGQVYGHAAAWGVCHLGFPGSCRTAPRSASGYTYFHLGEIACADGERLPVGSVTLDTGHADLKLDRAAATAHYDHTGTVIAHVRVGEDEYGIWVAGAVVPDAPAEKVRLFRGSKLSGDWRGKELVALLCVNVPGFPVPRAQALAASAADGQEPEVVALVAAGIPVFEAEIPPDDVERFRALKEHAEFAALAEQAV